MTFLIKKTKYISILILSSCIAPPSLYQEAFLRSKNAISSSKFYVTDSIRGLPYAMQIAKIGNSNEVLLVLAESSNDYLTWSSSAKELITTYNGKIIKTTGLLNDVIISNPPNIKDIYFNLKNNSNLSQSHRSFVSFSLPKANSLEMHYSYSLQQADIIRSRLMDKEINVVLLVETYKIPLIRFKGQNRYLIDAEGNVVKSNQKLVPNTRSFELETLKKYNGK